MNDPPPPPPPKERNPFKVTHRVALEMLVKVRCEQKFRSPSIFLSACTCDCACAVVINFGGRYFPNLYRLGVIAMSYRCYPSRKVLQRQQSMRPISPQISFPPQQPGDLFHPKYSRFYRPYEVPVPQRYQSTALVPPLLPPPPQQPGGSLYPSLATMSPAEHVRACLQFDQSARPRTA